MRLDRLEISGFKSFSDRAELAFDQGVTAIVGPNGCGKSNVADAITWVLGEQSAKSLRGEKMEDVIFSGSDARRAGGTAEVRLRLTGLANVAEHPGDSQPGEPSAVLDRMEPFDVNGVVGVHTSGHDNGHSNGNGHGLAETMADLADEFTRDVEVTRRLYRSGESEYLIDGSACRLRDVHELLMDTGLGAKAYSIIEQGKIGMILSSRPTDRRQLIEEAAGVTKYRSRRRAAELKLEAAQQNLTRVDDIVYEIERQRGTLKRQAAKARRHRRLQDELRRWEKVLVARRCRELAHDVESSRARLGEARSRETGAVARLAEVETTIGRLRIEQAEGDARAGTVREEAHDREMAITRLQQQIEFDRQQADGLVARGVEIADEVRNLDFRREPARIAIESRRTSAGDAERRRDEAAAALSEAGEAHRSAQQQGERFEGEVEVARATVYAAKNSAGTLRHAVEHAEAQKLRVAEALAKLEVEQAEFARECEAVGTERSAAVDALARAQQAMGTLGVERAARESELAVARTEHGSQAGRIRSREQELAGFEARLASLQELDAGRAGFDDAARMVLVQANGHVGQQGAVADYLEVESRYERAVEACLGELLQHVIVERHDQAAAGLALVREHDAGRCGFVVIDPGSNGCLPPTALDVPGVVPVANLLRISGPFVATIQKVLPEAYVADSFQQAVAVSQQTAAPVATIEGDVFRGPHLVAGGVKAEARGILQTRREIKELRARIDVDREALARLRDEVAGLDLAVAQSTTAIAGIQAEQHRQEKAAVGYEGQVARALDDEARLARKAEIVAFDCRQAEEERASLEARINEALESETRLRGDQQAAEVEFTNTQQHLLEVRDAVEQAGRRAAEAGAAHAGLLERASALSAEVVRLEEGALELEERIAARNAEVEQTRGRRQALLTSIVANDQARDDEVRALDGLREQVRLTGEAASDLRQRVEAQDVVIREARKALDAVRGEVGEFDVARARVESDLAHMAQTCEDTFESTLEVVVAEVEELERSGLAVPDAAAITAEEPDPELDEVDTLVSTDLETGGVVAAAALDAPRPAGSMSAEEAVEALKAKIDRLGLVNMMAIDQFDELDTRHAFLTTQRSDLVHSIAQTAEAISRIDETTKARFQEAFTAVQRNFQETFSTLFGGGRAGLSLLDENDPLESGIDIVASPPGKRLQNVQLLSGGEKALTAIALMFAIFKYKPSPFCLLDEIDAPLDDANVGRFVEMLRGMLAHTQFILITHNRLTMEIANRLYGVTMEEPGVSKLISVNLN